MKKQKYKITDFDLDWETIQNTIHWIELTGSCIHMKTNKVKELLKKQDPSRKTLPKPPKCYECIFNFTNADGEIYPSCGDGKTVLLKKLEKAQGHTDRNPNNRIIPVNHNVHNNTNNFQLILDVWHAIHRKKMIEII